LITVELTLDFSLFMSKICPSSSGSLAQLVEQFPFKELVVGSNPTRPTIS
jgi:hypothetical protein